MVAVKSELGIDVSRFSSVDLFVFSSSFVRRRIRTCRSGSRSSYLRSMNFGWPIGHVRSWTRSPAPRCGGEGQVFSSYPPSSILSSRHTSYQWTSGTFHSPRLTKLSWASSRSCKAMLTGQTELNRTDSGEEGCNRTRYGSPVNINPGEESSSGCNRCYMFALICFVIFCVRLRLLLRGRPSIRC